MRSIVTVFLESHEMKFEYGCGPQGSPTTEVSQMIDVAGALRRTFQEPAGNIAQHCGVHFACDIPIRVVYPDAERPGSSISKGNRPDNRLARRVDRRDRGKVKAECSGRNAWAVVLRWYP